MKKTLTIILIVIVVIAAIIAGAYYYIMNMPAKNVSSQKPDFTLEAPALAREYENAPEASNVKYIDRVIEVTGEVAEVSIDQNKSAVIILRDKDSSVGILCTMNESEGNKARQLIEGDYVTIKGTCTGMLFEVVLNKCVIVD